MPEKGPAAARGPHACRVTTVHKAAGSYATPGFGRDFATNEPGMRRAADITMGLFGKHGRTLGLLSNQRPAWSWLADCWPQAHKPHNRRARDGPRPWTLCRRPVVPYREDQAIRCGRCRHLILGEPRRAIHGKERRALGQRRCRVVFRDGKERDVSPLPVDTPSARPLRRSRVHLVVHKRRKHSTLPYRTAAQALSDYRPHFATAAELPPA